MRTRLNSRNLAFGILARLAVALAVLAGLLPSLSTTATDWLASGSPMPFLGMGPTSLLILLPFDFLGQALSGPVGGAPAVVALFRYLPIVLADIAILVLLPQTTESDPYRIARYYWLSPIAVAAAYWIAHPMLIALAMMVACLHALRLHQMRRSGAWLGLAIAGAPALGLLVPVFVTYLVRNSRYAEVRGVFFKALLISLLPILIVLFLPSIAMVALGDLLPRITSLSIAIAPGVHVLIFPLVYATVLAFIWQQGRVTSAMLNAQLIVVAIACAVLTTPSGGWIVWAAPLLAINAGSTGLRTRSLIWFYGVVAVMAIATESFGDAGALATLVQTLLLALGGVVAHRVIVNAWQSYDYWRISERQLAIGIAGDSGVGKSTLVDALVGIFGPSSTSVIEGDDYHNRDRTKPQWQFMTHLDPRGNNLHSMANDALTLLERQSVAALHYDHGTGHFTPPRAIRSGDVVIVSGLHALVPKIMRDRYDLSVFIEMREDLRRSTKILRDVNERGRSEADTIRAIDLRHADYIQYVHPQRYDADVVLRIEPLDVDWAERQAKGGRLNYKLCVELNSAADYQLLRRRLVADCLTFLVVEGADGERPKLHVDCTTLRAEDVAFLAAQLIPGLEEMLAIAPRWEHGLTGMMQLLILLELSRSRTSRWHKGGSH